MISSDPHVRIQAAMQKLGRRVNLPRLHDHFARRAGVLLDRGAYGALVRLADHGPLRISELARTLGVDSSTATRHVQSLESLGYASRTPDPGDARARLVVATDDGRLILDRLQSSRREVLGEVLTGWDRSDLEALARFLDRFADDLVDYVDRL